MATTAAQMKQKAKKAPEKIPLMDRPTSADARSQAKGGANIALIRAQLRQGITPTR